MVLDSRLLLYSSRICSISCMVFSTPVFCSSASSAALYSCRAWASSCYFRNSSWNFFSGDSSSTLASSCFAYFFSSTVSYFLCFGLGILLATLPFYTALVGRLAGDFFSGLALSPWLKVTLLLALADRVFRLDFFCCWLLLC